MRKQTELSPNCRAMSRSPKGWGDKVHLGTISGGGNEDVPSALAVLAANESVLMFWLVKLSGCRPDGGYTDEQSEDVSGSNHHQ